MYELTLTKNERSAIDWIGHRYAHGDDLREQLDKSTIILPHDDAEWDGDYDITYQVPENVAWAINVIIAADNLACFSDDMISKLLDFSAQIV